MKRLDLSNKIIGKLKVISYSHSYTQPSGQKRAMWNVICNCGTKKVVSTSSLSGRTISCGCYINNLRKNGINKKEKGAANLNYKYLSYKARAKNKNISFDVTKELFKEVIDKNCFYCGQEPTMHHSKRSFNGLYISNGIDRLDSNKGYEIGNILPCCKICNIMKSNLSYESFIKQINKIYDKIGLLEKNYKF